MNQRMTLKAVAAISVVTCGRASCAICNLISCFSPLRNVLAAAPRQLIRHCTPGRSGNKREDGKEGEKGKGERGKGKGKSCRRSQGLLFPLPFPLFTFPPFSSP